MFSRSRLNLAYWFALSMGSILIAFTGAVYYLEAEDQLRAFDDSLYLKTKNIDNQVYYRLEQGRWQLNFENVSLLAGENTPTLQNELVYIRWYDVDGELIQFAGLTPTLQKMSTQKRGFKTVHIADVAESENSVNRPLRELTIPVKYNEQLVGYIQSATLLEPLQADLAQALVVLTLSVPVTLGVIGLTGWVLGGMAMQPIRQSYNRLQRFTADASHELRTPLAVILSNAQVALIPSIRESAQQQDCVEEIEKAAKAMTGLIDDLLFLARHEGPLTGAALNKQVDMQTLLKPLVEHYTTQAALRNRKFISDVPLQPVMLKADPQLLRRAITNLLENAFKYTPPGGTVCLRFLTQAHCAMIQVEDNGIGIPETDLPHIFERFYRVDLARSRRKGGFGLGLSIAQQIVQAHDGQITAKSTIGEGTTFQIQLPLRKSIKPRKTT
ncbi:MAG: HAMP domain-containing sensor histidine kinase [Cyanobacteria bacterium P01_A01_bin.123]